jgi:Prion-inhibition and propagation
MDPLSLTFGIAGIVGLAGLYNTCLDVIDKVDSYKEYGIESRSMIAQFEADKLLFQKWGKNVGIDKNVLLDKHHRNLDDPQTVSSIEKILSSIQELYLSADNARLTLQPILKPDQKSKSSSGGTFLSGSHARYQMVQESTSKRKRVAWAFRNKAKFVAQVQQFGALVQRLQSLVPPDDMKGVTNMYNGPINDSLTSLNGMCFSSPSMKQT